MRATERRQALLEIICERRHEKMDNLAFELGVSRKTIIRDVLELSISYPIYTAAGRHDIKKVARIIKMCYTDKNTRGGKWEKFFCHTAVVISGM